MGGQKTPDRSGLQASLTKLSRQWHFGVGICAVAQWRNMLSFNPLLTMLVL